MNRVAIWARVVTAAGAAVAVFFVCAALVAGQGLEAAYTLRGTVVNSATGEPIRNALVMLGTEEVRSAFTGADGGFEFRDLRGAGEGTIAAKRPGYFSPQRVRMSAHSYSESPIGIRIGPDTAPLVLRLTPEAIIAGRVTGENGEPLESMPVQIYFQGEQEGHWSLEEVARLETDGDGGFRYANLGAGRYFVSIGPGRDVEKTADANGSARFGYGSGFYPSGADFASATPIDAMPGKETDLEVRMPMMPLFQVNGTVSGLPPGEGARVSALDETGELIDSESLAVRGQGMFHLGPLAGGTYMIEAEGAQQVLRTTRPLVLKADVAGLNLRVLPGASIPVSVRTEVEPGEVRSEEPGGRQRIARGSSVTTFSSQGRAVRIALIPRRGMLRHNGMPSRRRGRETNSRWRVCDRERMRWRSRPADRTT